MPPFQHPPDPPWIFRTYSGHSTPAESNKLYKANLARGQTGLSVAFDLPTQTGYDSDHILARGEVGKVGVPVGHLGDMRALFEGLPCAMLLRLRCLVILAGVLAVSLLANGQAEAEPVTLVKATPGYLYFNRPGATLETHDAELSDCLGASVVAAPTAQDPQPSRGVLEDALTTGIQNQMLAGWARARANINVELCMVVRGWRLMRLEDDEGRRLAGLDRRVLASALEPWIGVTSPPGEMVRTWHNDLAFIGTIADRSPANASRVLLSEFALSENPAAPAQRVQRGEQFVWGTPVNPTELASIGSIPSDRAIIVISLYGPRSVRISGRFYKR